MLEDDVIEIISDRLFVKSDKIFPSSKLIDDLGARSLDLIALVMDFEETYNMNISDEDAEKIVCVADAIEYVRNNAVSYARKVA